MAFGRFRDLLKSGGFQSFLWTQLLGAFNDNVYKIVVSLLAASLAAGSGSSALALAGAVFIIPFILFSGYAGHLADVYNKRSVLIATKSFEVVAMALALLVFYLENFTMMLAVLFLMALQAAFFSPAKYGILPEMAPDKDLSRANALLQMSTNMAIIAGTWLGGEMIAAWRGRVWLVGYVLVLAAAVGFATSFGISRVPPPRSTKPFQWNPFGEIIDGLKRIYRDKPFWLTVLAISYFWFLGALLQLVIILFSQDVLKVSEEWTARLITALGVGIGIGSLAAGRLSGDKVELGLTPLGSIGMGAFALWLAASGNSYTQAAIAMGFLGLAGGLFIVPLNALMQQRAGEDERGRVIAANNFLNMFGILLASGFLYVTSDLLHFTPDRVILAAGLLTFLVTIYILTVVPDFLIRFSLWMFTHTIYKIRIEGQQHVPFRGPALLVANHLSFLDGFLVGACVQRFVRFLIYRPYFEKPAFRWILTRMHAIPIQGGDPERVAESIALARSEIEQGHVVCIFAEGSISRTGNMLPFKPGFERIMKDLDAPIIPVNLDRVWGSVFSYKRGRFFPKWPEKLPRPVTVSFGPPLPANSTAQQVRQAVMELGSEAAETHKSPRDQLHLRFMARAKRRWRSQATAGPRGEPRSYGRLLVDSVLLARRVRKIGALAGDSDLAAIVLPASYDAAAANLAVQFAGKTALNLDASADPVETQGRIAGCSCGLVLASHEITAIKDPGDATTVYVEEALARFSPIARLWTALYLFLLPNAILRRIYGNRAKGADAPAHVVYTAGTGGQARAAVLSHWNIVSNSRALAQVFWVTREDRFATVLPLHHAFGLTGTLWFPLLSGCAVAWHRKPSDASAASHMARDFGASILVANTAWLTENFDHIPVDDFETLKYVFTGGDSVSEKFRCAWETKFRVPLMEGYGCTEMAPLIAVNVPDYVEGHRRQAGTVAGSVGHPIPGVSVKVVDPATGMAVATGRPGLLLAKGPNRMLGYFNDPAATAAVFRDGWFSTGDTAVADDNGFLRILARNPG